MSSEPKHKLAAIMFTDIVGYSNIMSLDEKKGIKILERHDEIIHPVIEKNSGKILKRMGDAIFAEFASSVNAVRCAIDIQTALKDFNSDKSLEDMIIIRIGIYLDDVMVHGDDLFGEGINVAARLEPLASPGGICLSQAVYQSVQSSLDLSAILVGEMELKNIIEKYVVYKIPPFYAEELAETSVSVKKGEKRIFDFKIDSIKRIPPPKRSFWTVLPFGLLLSPVPVLIGIMSFLLISPNLGLWPGDIEDPELLIGKLKSNSDPISQGIRNKLLTTTKKLIDEYEDQNRVSLELKIEVQKDLQRLVMKKQLIFDDQVLDHINISEKTREQIEANPIGDDMVLLNRSLLAEAFPQEIAADHPHSLTIIKESIKFFRYKIPYFNFFIIGLMAFFVITGISQTYYIALATVQVKFSDVRHVDEMLEYFVLQMGFKPSTKELGDLVFKPSRSKYIKDIFYQGFPTKLRARIDGNSVIITSTIPTVKRLTKQLKVFSN